MGENVNAIKNDLKTILGAEKIITDQEILKRNSLDYVGYRNYERYHKQYDAFIPICIVKPESVQEVSEILKYLNENKINCVPRTGNSGSTAGGEAGDVNTVFIDGSSMNKILLFDEQNMLVTVQCGTPLEYLEKYANKKGYTTGHFPQSLPMAHLGGLTATRSIGQFSTLYGGIEDMVIGLEAVLPDGEIIRIKNVPRRSAGPDIRHLFIGSEGTLAYITEVTIRLFKYEPDNRWMQAYAVKDMQTGLDILQNIMVNGYKPAVARLHDYGEASVSYSEFVKEGESLLLFIVEGPKEIAAATGAAIDKYAFEKGARAVGRKPLEIWLVHRNDLCDQMDDNDKLRNGIVGETCEVAANWTEIRKIYENVIARVQEETDGLVYITGHSSHSYMQGTNIYFMYGYKAEKDFDGNREKYFKLLSIILEETLKLGGTIAHHHGIGKYRSSWTKDEHGSAYRLLQILKNAFDPNAIMNKGTLLPESKS
jgi:FAD/FMN-containing dehydrogenase